MELGSWFFFKLGFSHILDINAYDHIAYLFALCAVFTLLDWRKALILATAFTIGHSLTLGLVGIDFINLGPIGQSRIEFLIPITIILTAVANLVLSEFNFHSRVRYILAIVFGLIHGLGFSTFFKSMSTDNSTDIISQLLFFNFGVEAGQLLFVLLILILSYFFVEYIRLSNRLWTFCVNILAIFIAFYLILA